VTAAEREAHIRELAAEIGVDDVRLVREPESDGTTQGWAGRGWYSETYAGQHNLGDAWIIVKGWRGGSVGYFAALHELGHHALGHQSGNRPMSIFDREAAAWEWALGQARERPNARVRYYLQHEWLGSYGSGPGSPGWYPRLAETMGWRELAFAA
jgi:hypothetical protein